MYIIRRIQTKQPSYNRSTSTSRSQQILTRYCSDKLAARREFLSSFFIQNLLLCWWNNWPAKLYSSNSSPVRSCLNKSQTERNKK